MKNTITSLLGALLFSTMAFGQNQQGGRDTTLKSWSIGLRAVHLYDLPVFRFDSPMSRDLWGLNGEKTSFDLAGDLYVEKMFTPVLGAQLGMRFGKITGANEVEYYTNTFYQGQLDLIFILSNLDVFHTNSRWNFYGKTGVGSGSFDAEQFLLADDSPDNQISEGFWESHIGIGVQYELNNQWRVELESMYTTVFNDGFDGFNTYSGSDNIFTTALGVAYTFGKKQKQPMYAVNYFGGKYMEMGQTALPPVPPAVPLVTTADPVKTANSEQVEALEEQMQAQQNTIEALKAQMAQQKSEKEEMKSQTYSTGAVNRIAVFFTLNGSSLSSEAKRKLVEALGDISNKNQTQIALTAYADKTGSEDYNQDLKQRRGEAVRSFLTHMGFTAENISIELGQAMDLEANNQYLNRKVTVSIP